MDSKQLQQINDYKVLNRVNEGSSAVIYRVEHKGEEFALKLLKSTGADVIARFRRETSSLARLNDPNLIKIYDVGEYEQSVYLVTEYLAGLTVEQRLALEALDEKMALHVTVSVAKALREIHKHSLVHRDVKPANIFVKENGEVKLIDLGLVGDIEQVKQETAFVGTPAYMSPEQSKILKRIVDGRSDLYSLGATLFRMLTGRPPFEGNLNDIIQQHASTVAPRMSSFKPNVRPSLDAIVNKLLAKDPDDRYQSANAVIWDLERLEEIDKLISAAKDPQLGRQGQSLDAVKSPFVPRPSELTKIREVWDLLTESESRLVMLTGPSGIGKTRMANEFLASVRSDKVLTLSLRCDSTKSEIPFAPFRSSFENIIENLTSGNVGPSMLEKFKRATTGRESELVALAPAFKKICGEVAQSQKTTSDPETDKELFLAALSDFILGLNDAWEKIVIFLDDIHHLDMSSIQLIQRMMENCASRRILILGATTDEEAGQKRIEVVREIAGSRFFGTIEVSPFSREQATQNIRNYLGAHSIASTVLETFSAKAGGSPFLLAEYLYQAIEQGYLRFRSNEWNLDSSRKQLEFTADVIALFMKRFDSCNADAKALLERAAIAGAYFNASDIQVAFGLEPQTVSNALQHATAMGVVESGPGNRWQFAHDKVSSSILSRLSDDVLARYSATLASYISKKAEHSPDDIFLEARLSRQAEALLALEAVVEAQIRAGQFAMSSQAYNEAYNYLQYAYSILEKADPASALKPKICPPLAICASAMNEHQLALACVDFLVERAKTKLETFEANALKLWILTNASRFVDAWEVHKVTVRLLGLPHPEYLHMKLLHLIWAWFLSILHEFVPFKRNPRKYFGIPVDVEQVTNTFRFTLYGTQITGNLLNSCIVSLRMLRIGQITGDRRTKALGYCYIGYMFAVLGLKSLFYSYFARAARIYQKMNNPALTAACEMRRLLGSAYVGVTNDFIPEYTKFVDSFRKYLPPAELSLLRSTSGLFFGFRGLHEEAIRTYKSMLHAFQNRTMLVTPHAYVIILQQLWFNLAAAGQNQESQSIRAIAFEENNKLRFNPSTTRQAINAEMGIGRLSLKIDNTIDELVTFFVKRLGASIAEPISVNYLSNAAYLRLCQYRDAKTTEEKFATGHELRTILTRLSLTSFCPMFRANYYYLCGAFYSLLNNRTAADLYLRKAEKSAGENGNLLVLFEIQIERARQYLREGNLELMKLRLSSALNLASKHSWKIAIDRLFQEFETHIDFPKDFRASSHGTSSTVHETTMGTRMGGATIMGGSTIMNGSTIMSSSSQLGAVDYQAQRIVQATLNVSNAFVTSIDSTSQSKAVLTELIKLFGAERGFIFAVNAAGELAPIAGMSSQNTDLQTVKSYSTTVVKKVFEGQQAIVLAGTDEAEDLGSDSAVLYNLRSIMATPLMTKGKALGVVYLDTSLVKGLFSKDDVELFNTLGSQISVALELSRMTRIELDRANLRRELDIQSAIVAESKKVKILIDNMQQALFSVANDGKIVEPVSRYSMEVFGSDIANANVFDILFSEFKNDRERMDNLKTTIEAVFGEGDIQWSLMESNFPRKVRLPALQADSAAALRTIRVQPSPIWDNDQNLERVLFVAEDVTNLEALEQQVSKHREQAALLSEVLESPRNQLREFLSNVSKILAKVQGLVTKPTAASFAEAMRDLHTMKGNARLLKLMLLSKQIHESESELINLKEHLEDASTPEAAKQQVVKIESTLTSYSELIKRLFPEQASGEQLGISPLAMEQLQSVAGSLRQNLPAKDSMRLAQACERLNFRSLATIASQFDSMVKDLAQQLNKSVALEITGDALVSKDQADHVQEILLHLIRNSMDHGLESPNDRTQSGKSDTGHVRVQFTDHIHSISISVSDDGRGLDASRIAKSAVGKKLITSEKAEKLSDQDKIELIFMPGFSTKDEASQISGRGVGMDVVQQNVNDMGGKVIVETVVGKGSTFKFEVKTAYQQSLREVS